MSSCTTPPQPVASRAIQRHKTSRPATSRPTQRATKVALAIAGTLALIATLFTFIAPTASAAPTAGSKNSATTMVTIKVAPPAANPAPSLQLSFTTNNASRCRVTQKSPWVFANNSQFTWRFTTNYDPTPSNVTNSDQVDCSYTATVAANLADCSFSIDRGSGSSTATSFTLAGDDSPNYSTGAGNFSDLGASKTITITPSSCTAPTSSTSQGVVTVRNLETSERFQVNFRPFGNCQATSGGNIAQGTLWVYSVLDLKCNWQMTATSLDNTTRTGCVVDAIVYFTDSTQTLSQGASVFIGGDAQGFPSSSNKRIARIDLLASSSAEGSIVCEEKIRLTIDVNLAPGLNANNFQDEEVSFTITPFSGTEHRQCTQRTTVTSTARTSRVVELVKSPAGVATTCSYTITAAASALLRLSPTQTVTRNFGTNGITQLTLSYLYIANRLPVQISTQINVGSGSIYTTNDRIGLRVTVPGTCGTDTLMFGGVTGSNGVSYGVIVSPGTFGVVGPGARSVNPAALYNLPPYLLVNAQQQACSVRVTEISSADGCVMLNALRDQAGRPYQQVTWSQGLNAFGIALTYNCTLESSTSSSTRGRAVLPRGWVMLPFNGATGTTPSTFRQALGNSFNSVWVWDLQTQNWKGWRSGGGTASLTSLNKGDVVFVFVPKATRVNYSPISLLDPTPANGTKSVPRGWSLLSYAGSTSASLDSLLTSNIRLVYRWNNDTQAWNYFVPGGTRGVSSAVWFDTVSPGDNIFLLNTNNSAVSIRWP